MTPEEKARMEEFLGEDPDATPSWANYEETPIEASRTEEAGLDKVQKRKSTARSERGRTDKVSGSINRVTKVRNSKTTATNGPAPQDRPKREARPILRRNKPSVAN